MCRSYRRRRRRRYCLLVVVRLRRCRRRRERETRVFAQRPSSTTIRQGPCSLVPYPFRSRFHRDQREPHQALVNLGWRGARPVPTATVAVAAATATAPRTTRRTPAPYNAAALTVLCHVIFVLVVYVHSNEKVHLNQPCAPLRPSPPLGEGMW